MKRIDRKNMDRRVLLAGIGGVVAGTMFAGRAKAGVLEPPGAPAPTGQTTDQLANRASRTPQGCANPCIPVSSLSGSSSSTVVIDTPGSYMLTEPLFAIPGGNGIEITASDVELDFCGFPVVGSSGPGGLATGAGVVCSGENVAVYEGSVRGFAVSLDFSQASRFILWDMTCMAPTTFGVLLGSNGECFDVDVHNCPNTGFDCRGHGTLVEESGAWTCGTGFACVASPISSNNLFLSNCATGCATPYLFQGGCSYGPIAQLQNVGDISVVVESRHIDSNAVY